MIINKGVLAGAHCLVIAEGAVVSLVKEVDLTSLQYIRDVPGAEIQIADAVIFGDLTLPKRLAVNGKIVEVVLGTDGIFDVREIVP